MTSLEQRKSEIRSLAAVRRRDLAKKDEASRRIISKLIETPAFQLASTILLYLDVRNEVRTRMLPPKLFERAITAVVPFCEGDQLRLFHLESLDELESGAFGILEPRIGLRSLPEKQIAAENLDLIVVPGVAFDRRGARLGYGRGFYDRLLRGVRADTTLVGLAFECQMFDEVPAADHDVFMDQVITESGVYVGHRNSLQMTLESPA